MVPITLNIMSIFDEIKRSLSNRFLKNPYYLSDSYIPENPPYRKEHIIKLARYVVECINYNLSDTILLEGLPGTGKTMCFKIVERYISSEVNNSSLTNCYIVYVNGRGLTVIEVLRDILHSLGIPVPARGFGLGYYLSILKDLLATTKMHIHICVDEIDRVGLRGTHGVEDLLYVLSRYEGISSTIITNDLQFAKKLKDPGVKSSLTEFKYITFEKYTVDQCYTILKDRCELAFNEGAITDEAIHRVAEIVGVETGDIRDGLHTLRIAAYIAESRGKNRITEDIIDLAWNEVMRKKVVNSILTIPPMQRAILLAMYINALLGMREQTSYDILDVYNKLRMLLGRDKIDETSFRVKLSELERCNVISVKRVGRGDRKGVERLYRLECPLDILAEAFKNDPYLRDVFRKEVEEKLGNIINKDF